MTISTTDLKIFKAQRNRDTADGGGAMSPNEVVDGELNNVFDDISSQDRTSGRVSIRKGFPGAYSPNTDKYFGAGLVIIAPAEDDDVDILMTHTGDFVDERSDIVQVIEGYQVPGSTLLWRLWNNQAEGSASLALYAPNAATTPNIGATLFLEDTSDGDVEAVRVKDVISRAEQTFFDGNGNAFQRDVLTLELTRPLQNTWEGTEVLRNTGTTPPTRLRSATVASGAWYGGVKAAESISQNDLTVQVPSVYGQLVPSNTSETPITDEQASLSGVSYTQSGAADSLSASASQSFAAGDTKTWFVGTSLLPGSVEVTGTITGTDNGDGTLSIAGSTHSGEIDYQAGSVSITRNASGSLNLTITATPAAAVQDASQTLSIPVTSETRQQTYVRTLRPVPAPGTLTVSYRALDNWYTLTDDGTGSLSGQQPGEGGGSVNYSTGSVTITLAELPDVGTDIIVAWGTPNTVQDVSGDIALEAPEITATLTALPVKPGTVAISYLSDSATINLSDDGEGNIDIDGGTTGVGRIVYSTGELAFRPADWPDDNANIVIDYETSAEQLETFNPTPSGAEDDISFSLDNTPVRPGSVDISFVTTIPVFGGRNRTVRLRDDGVGGFVDQFGNSVDNSTIDYSNGAVAIQAGSARAEIRLPMYEVRTRIGALGTTYETLVFVGYGLFDRSGDFESGNTVTVKYQEDSASSSAEQDTVEAPPVTIDLIPMISDQLVPGSVRFTLNGRTYVDRSGDLVYGVSTTTNAATVAGTINYSAGKATITDWTDGNFQASVVSAGLQDGVAPTHNLYFRTPSAPVAQASLTVQAISHSDGSQLQATADVNGDLTAPLIEGKIDVNTGVVRVRFGELVTAAGNEDEWWYDAAAVDGDGNIWKPEMILPGSATFSCVVFTSIPIDPQILGLDPIRLPANGRVPIYRPGDTLVASQRNEVEDSDPSAGEVVDLGINNVRWVRVKDAEGAEVLSEHYTVDGPSGELQWANPLDLSAYNSPYTIESLAYFMRLCTDVEINGTVHLSAAAPYPLDNNDAPVFLSTKLIFTPDGGNQDLQALYTNLFTQDTWTGEWSDDPTSGGTTGQYDDANFPILMRNDGAITERWRLQFTSSNTVNVIGERLGQILTDAPISSDISPVNPATSQPYFTFQADGFSSGWNNGETIRVNTLGANYPVWLIRSTQPGDPDDSPSDRFISHLMGDVAKEDD
jgi:hypothetical protein